MLYIKIPNVIYKNPIFAPPARQKPPMLYIKIEKLYIMVFLKGPTKIKQKLHFCYA